MPEFLGFQFRTILTLYGILFHAVVVLGPDHNFLLKSDSTYCDLWPEAAAAAFKAFKGDLVKICILLELGGGGGGIIFTEPWFFGKVKELTRLGLGNGGGTGGGA